MESAVKVALGTNRFEPTGSGGGGSISNGAGYWTDNGIVFVKVNQKDGAKCMFDGEKAGLDAILATKTIRVPKPIKVVSIPGKTEGAAALVMEFLEFGSGDVQAKLGEQFAKMHLYNQTQLAAETKNESRINTNRNLSDEDLYQGPVSEYGFDIPTCCGYLPLDNSWNKDWTTFYIRQRLQPQVDRIIKEHGNRELIELWNTCMPVIEKKLNKVESVTPSLLHGDLWSGNFAVCDNQPVIFDPATFYGHHEFDLGIGFMFGGFRKAFYENYHRFIPKSDGFEERKDIYELFHHLNHWNHFGGSYKGSTLQILRTISSMKK